jgi:hypothetical protein
MSGWQTVGGWQTWRTRRADRINRSAREVEGH